MNHKHATGWRDEQNRAATKKLAARLAEIGLVILIACLILFTGLQPR